ncbi:CYTH domain-containing protein [Oceanospirillum multiglobuliferum]|nr:CYTH domain-containing protein [Oceanospirillum multiglobuliferum]SKA12659.1 CYTH domain-containing protein [Oceanospirillum multiglobuliferum]
MAKETELKLAIPLRAQELIRQHPILRQAKSYDKTLLQNTYFDTPDLVLNRAKVALRIRKSGERYIQTLKTQGKGNGGLHQRGEWEWVLKQNKLDLSLIDPDLWPNAIDPAYLQKHLAPVFETNFTRDRWLLDVSFEDSRAEVELACDNGHAIANKQRDPISEIELELVSGDAELIFKIAHDLSAQIPLMISNISKAQRGFRLSHPVAAGLAPRKPAPPTSWLTLVQLAQFELDQFIAAKDQLNFDHQWSRLTTMSQSLFQIRWCLYQLHGLSEQSTLRPPAVMTYKLRMLNYGFENLAAIENQQQAWQRLKNCPDKLRQAADFMVLNEQYQKLILEPWVGETLLEITQLLYLFAKEPKAKAVKSTDDVFHNLLVAVKLPSHPTDRHQWLQQSPAILRLSRWISYHDLDQTGLGTKALQKDCLLLINKAAELRGLMAEEWTIRNELPEAQQPALLKRTEEDQYQKVLELGRIALSFNSLQDNLRHY